MRLIWSGDWEESISGTDKDEDAGGEISAEGLNAVWHR
jgi:hypothetical protein